MVVDVRTNAQIVLPDRKIVRASNSRYIQEVRTNITSPTEAIRYFRENIYVPFDHCLQEEFWVLMLDAKNVVTHQAMIYRGTITMVVIRLAEVFRPVIATNATAIIIGHNHPSGDPTPSPEDVQVTRSLVEAGQLLGVEVLDHIVVGAKLSKSLKEAGLGFE
jgi:DNA repair protein RadC